MTCASLSLPIRAPRASARRPGPFARSWAAAIGLSASAALGPLSALAAPAPGPGDEGPARVIVEELSFPAPAVELTEDGLWTVVSLPGSEPTGPLGAPELPSVGVRLRLAPGERVVAAALDVLEEDAVHLERPLRPYAGGRSTEEEQPPSAAPDPQIYGSEAIHPAERIGIGSSFTLSRGATFGIVRVHPLRVRSRAGELVVTRRARLSVTVAGGAALLRGAGAGADAGGAALLRGAGTVAGAARALGDGPVRYLIITGDDPALVAAWQPLADWKTASGDPAQVVTTEWVREQYPAGADLAEKIRMLLRESYESAGLAAVLLGGDTDIVPTRIVGTGPNEVSSDYYYACLDGSWDRNGNGIYGERPRDEVDLIPELQVGRVSARTADHVEAFLEKYFAYVQAPPEDGYLDRGLMVGEVLFSSAWSRDGRGPGVPDCHECGGDTCRIYQNAPVCVAWDGAEDCFAVEETLAEAGYPGRLDFLLERAEYWAAHEPIHSSQVESRESVLAAMSAGYNFVLQVGHGSWDRWAVGDGRLVVADLPLLTNGDQRRYFVTYGVNCSSASILLDGFGEKIVLLPDQGALAYIGSTYASSAGWAAQLAEDFFYYLFVEEGGTLGDGFNGSAAASAQFADYIIFGRVLQGEPAMPVWRGTPGRMEFSLPETVTFGDDSLRVELHENSGGAPVAGAKVCLRKDGEVYEVGLTGPDGAVRLPFPARTAGAFHVTATSPAYRPVQAEGAVTGAASGVALRAAEPVVGDGDQPGAAGNGNGRIETGETVRLALTVENLGGASSALVTGRLRTASAPAGLITLVDSLAAWPVLAPGAGATDAEAFAFAVDPVAGDAQFGPAGEVAVDLRIELEQAGVVAVQTAALRIARPRLEAGINRWEPIAGDSARVWIGLIHTGRGTASRLRCALAPAPGDTAIAAVAPAALAVADLGPGDALEIGPFTVTRAGAGPGRLRFAVTDTLHTAAGALHEREIATGAPPAPVDVRAVGLREAVELRWEDPEGGAAPAGYAVFRAAEAETSFVAAHRGVLREHRYLLDERLADLTPYRYRVVALDAGGNPSPASETVTVSTSPGSAPGWPQQFLYGAQPASPLICEFDCLPGPEGCTHAREIFFGGDILQAYHGQGAEVADGDDNVITPGPFSLDPPADAAKLEFRGKAAAADLDGDGVVELLAVARQYNQLLCWGPNGGEPRWAAALPASVAWRTPVLADLDGDGDLEVITTGGELEHEGIFVFDHEGGPHRPGTNGQVADFGDRYLYHPPAVGDVDGDGGADIVMSTRLGTIHAIAGASGEHLPGLAGLACSQWEAGQSGRAAPTLADVDGQPGDEIFVVTTSFLWSFGREGILRWRMPLDLAFGLTSTVDLYPEAALGDIDGDGQIDLAVVDAAGTLWARRAFDGALLENFPIALEDGATIKYGSCILASVDADSLPEIVFGDGNGRIHAFTAAGLPARGFPIEFGGNFSKMSLAAWDVDGDGYQNLVAQAEGLEKLGVYDLAEAPFDPARNPWPMRHHDARNSGRYADPARAAAVTEPLAQVSAGGVVDLRWSSAGPVVLFEVRRWGPRSGGLPGAMRRVGVVPGNLAGGPAPPAILDTLESAGVYSYCVNPIGTDGLEQTGASVQVEWLPAGEDRFALEWAGPNPGLTGGTLRVAFRLPTDAGAQAHVALRLYDVQGRLVRELLDEPVATGPVTFEWQGRDQGGRPLPGGLYILELKAAGERATSRVLLLH